MVFNPFTGCQFSLKVKFIYFICFFYRSEVHGVPKWDDERPKVVCIGSIVEKGYYLRTK